MENIHRKSVKLIVATFMSGKEAGLLTFTATW
jgi:hypothetical protein